MTLREERERAQIEARAELRLREADRFLRDAMSDLGALGERTDDLRQALVVVHRTQVAHGWAS